MKQFKNPSGVFYTKGLFFETTLADKSTCLYTLKDEDHCGLPSLYRLYMESNDPTEWKFATTHLGGWSHWESLLGCKWFEPYIERWRRELELRMKSIALSRIMAESKTSSRESFNANKYLLEKGWVPKDQAKRGRPSKEEINKAAKEHVELAKTFEDDLSRLGIRIN